MKILVAEDDELYSGLYDRMFAKWGYSFDLVSDGKEAVERAVENEGRYDICLMDVDMPRMSGYEAARLIRSRTKYFPILGVTGNVSVKDRYFECGMDDYLKKPFNLDEIRGKIDELTIKCETLICNDKEVTIKKEMPMDQQQAKELRELAKQGLCKMILRGTGAHDVSFIVHKNIPNNIAFDFIESELELTTFLDRNKENPSECFLFKASCLVPTVVLENDIYEIKLREEDEKLKNREVLITKKESGD